MRQDTLSPSLFKKRQETLLYKRQETVQMDKSTVKQEAKQTSEPRKKEGPSAKHQARSRGDKLQILKQTKTLIQRLANRDRKCLLLKG